jgi:hypothetical protein
MSNRSFTAIWTAAFWNTALPGSNVRVVVTNICWPTYVKGAIFAHPAIVKPGRWNTNQRMDHRRKCSTRWNGCGHVFPYVLQGCADDKQPGSSVEEYIREPDYPAEAKF